MAYTPAWDDLNAFVDAADFAVEAQLIPQSGQPRQVVGIYDGPTIEPQAGEFRANTVDSSFEGTMAALNGIVRGDTLRIEGQDYVVLSPPQPDGTGMGVLRLSPA